MVVDSSVLLQILYRGPGAEQALHVLASAALLKIAAPTLLEAEVVYGASDDYASRDVLELVERLGVEVVPFTSEHAREARLAYARFGKGCGHVARLNFGDCVSYALARVTREPLAFEGDDFHHTDLEVVRLG